MFLNLQNPFIRLRVATHGKQVVPPLSSSQRGQSLSSCQGMSPLRIEPRGHGKAERTPGADKDGNTVSKGPDID